MNTDDAVLSHHPAPHRQRVAPLAALFGLVGGPLAWFVQLCASYALASAPCFSQSQLAMQPTPGSDWTWPAMITLLIAGVIVASAALLVSYRAFARTRDESGGDQEHLMEVGAGRTRFLALWGMLLGAGFAVATAVTAVAFLVLPRCAA